MVTLSCIYYIGLESEASPSKPRTLEIEYFLGACADIQNAGLPPPVMNNFDPKDPHRIVKSFDIAAKVPPTPAFPIVSALSFYFKHNLLYLGRPNQF